MEYLKVRTKGNSNPQGKPRVYFTCHPDDFGRSFEKICEDIFKSHDCAVYYTEDMSADVPDSENSDISLEQMNLFVIPVSFRLLSTESRTMNLDYHFAVSHNIPVLPIMLETGLDEIYSRTDKFGEKQYLNPYSRDRTEIGYEEKLKKYLDSVLIDDKTAERVRAAFDAYIFLSYRKKDRRYANELMRIIHSNPICRDIAIWYDEFLIPGESFNDMIAEALEKSELFTLLVTPNLVNEENYVKSVEYPEAQKAGKCILPAEMVSTNKFKLKKQYAKLPKCVNAYDEKAFRKRILESISRIAKRENDNDPEHNFLIGLAYLGGIDVEVDRERALELITGAARAELPEAMSKLAMMYHEGSGTALNWREELKWRQRLADYCTKTYGENHPDALSSLNNLALAYGAVGDYKKELELMEKSFSLSCEIFGEEHPDTLKVLSNLALTYINLGECRKAAEINEKCYELRCKVLGEDHPDTLMSLNNLAVACEDSGDLTKAMELSEKCYKLRCDLLGEDHPDTLMSLNNLASSYCALGERKKALELGEKNYCIHCKVLGEEHPAALAALNNLAFYCGGLGDLRKAQELNEKCYELRCKVLGEEHPDTLISLNNLAGTYGDLGDCEKSLKLKEKCYELRCKVLGKEHPDSLMALNNLASSYSVSGNFGKAMELFEKAYEMQCKVLGEAHPVTLRTLNNSAVTCGKMGDRRKALELLEKFYETQCKVFGEEHPDVLITLNNLASAYGKLGDQRKAQELNEECYVLRCKVLGEGHPDTLKMLNNLLVTHHGLGEMERALEICDRVLQSDWNLDKISIENIGYIYEQNGLHEKAAAIRARYNP